MSHLELHYGLRPEIALDPCKAYGKNDFLFSSDTKTKRVSAMREMLGPDGPPLVISARGAYGCVELLPLVDFDSFKGRDKLFVGFSDTTALLVTLYQRSGIYTVHGPSLESSFSKAAAEPEAMDSCEALMALVRGERPQPFESPLRLLAGAASAEGPLIGGNLSVLASLMGTPWEPSFDGHVLFLEELGERPYRVHRMLLQMKLAGKLDRVAGIVLGSFKDCVHPQGLGPTVDEVFADIFSGLRAPVLSGARFGHENPNMPVPLGMRARLSVDGLELLY